MSRVRLTVSKTNKLYIGGKFPRSESGRCMPVTKPSGEFIANIAHASRKDARDSVVAARAAQHGWAAVTEMNRGQIIYRIAEMLESRSDEFVSYLMEIYGLDKKTASKQIEESVDSIVWYAGSTGKLGQVKGGVNQVAGDFLNVSVPTPMGVAVVIATDPSGLLGLVQSTLPLLAAGNTTVVMTGPQVGLIAVAFAEVLATSDVPAGVVNILTGSVDEVAPWLAGHMDVNAVDLAGADSSSIAELQKLAAENLKRILPSPIGRNLSLSIMSEVVETKTIWYPSGL